MSEAVRSALPRLVAVRRDLHQHPELPNREFRTGRLLAERLRELGLEVRHPVARTGVVAILRSRHHGRVVALRAAIDALPLKEEHDSPFKSRVPGLMHACGHDAQTALLLAAAEVLTSLREALPGSVVFIFQPAEEGAPEAEPGGAAMMLKEGALSNPVPDAIIGFHVDPTLDTGTVGWTDGVLFAGSDRFEIDVRGTPTHGAHPHAGNDPLPASAEIILAVRALVPGQAARPASATATIGTVRGGSHFDLIADRVVLEGALRAQSTASQARLRDGLQALVGRIATTHGVNAAVRFVGRRIGPTVNDALLARRVRPSLLSTYGDRGVVSAKPQMSSEDFSEFADRVPCFYFLLGVRNAAKGLTAMTHTPDFEVDEDALPRALEALVRLSWDVLATGP